VYIKEYPLFLRIFVPDLTGFSYDQIPSRQAHLLNLNINIFDNLGGLNINWLEVMPSTERILGVRANRLRGTGSDVRNCLYICISRFWGLLGVPSRWVLFIYRLRSCSGDPWLFKIR
jgi:hypothetical protein